MYRQCVDSILDTRLLRSRTRDEEDEENRQRDKGLSVGVEQGVSELEAKDAFDASKQP